MKRIVMWLPGEGPTWGRLEGIEGRTDTGSAFALYANLHPLTYKKDSRSAISETIWCGILYRALGSI